VFIIGSGSREFKKDLDAIVEILNGFGLKGYFALLSEKEKGLDAFCDKICSKIREAQFCVAMLNDPVDPRHVEGSGGRSESIRTPSANVYYEFGMAVAIGKNVIPVVHKGLRLPFDVQHIDAIYYDSIRDLKRKLKKPILANLRRKPKEAAITAADSELVKLVYGPLYNEIDRFLSRRDKFSSFSHSNYDVILSQYKYLLDTTKADLRKKIRLFYDELEEFNNSIHVAERTIHEIVEGAISDFFEIPTKNSRSISVGLVTDTSHILPTLDQILIRKTTPELYLQATGSLGSIRRITYKLVTPDYPEKDIDPMDFKGLFKKCREQVESNPKIMRMRELATDLEVNGKDLKRKLKQFC